MQHAIFNVMRNEIDVLNSDDISAIEMEAENEGFVLGLPTDMKVLQSSDFFHEKKEAYDYVQSGRKADFADIDFAKPFLAYTNSAISICPMTDQPIREIVAYVPESN